MKSFHFALLPFALYFIRVCVGHKCIIKEDLSGVISESLKSTTSKCWTIEVPRYMYAELNIKQLNLSNAVSCSDVYLKVTITKKNERYVYCEGDRSYRYPITASSDVTITFTHRNLFPDDSSSFILEYRTEHPVCSKENHFRCSNIKCIEGSQVCNGVEDCDDGSDEMECDNLICKQINHFLCSTRTCINYSKVCDDVKDCDNGSDEIGCRKGVLAVKGVNASRESTGAWLLKNRQSGWGRNTHRAITALFLGQVASFREQNLEEELMVKQLELQTSLALLRNSTDPLSVSELSMFVNALSVACDDPRRFYGYDLVKILGERVSVATSQSPGAYLTLCNSNWTLTQSDIRSLLHLLHKNSTYPFALDVQALTLMALTCAKNLQEKDFTGIHNASNIYNATVEKFITGQLSDGSFGNVYTTALITQALIASGQENNPKWNVTSTIQYLMKQLNFSSVDFLSAYLALPIFSGRSLVDMAAVNCTNISIKQDEDKEISDLTNKLGGKIHVQYSLYVGDQRDVLHTTYLRLPEKSSAYEVMKIAQVANPEYKFRHRNVSGHMYVYEIAGIINDPEAGKFWLMYSENSNKIVEHHTESPDKFIVDGGEHLIMWYKTGHI